MRPSIALQKHREAIRRIVVRNHAANARVFGSVLNGTDKDDSDLDLLVDTTNETTLMDLGAIRLELRGLLGVDVDVLTPDSLPDAYRQQVIKNADPV